MSKDLPYPIGVEVTRDRARRLLAGRGNFVDDIAFSRMLHMAFLRSPYPHARIANIDTTGAAESPATICILTDSDLVGIVEPWRPIHKRFPDMRAPLQTALARGTVRYQGEPIVAVIATSRAEAEDACELIDIEYEQLDDVGDVSAALAPNAPLIHDEFGDNVFFRSTIRVGDPDAALNKADVVVEETFRFHRHTGVSLETRSIIADFDPNRKTIDSSPVASDATSAAGSVFKATKSARE